MSDIEVESTSFNCMCGGLICCRSHPTPVNGARVMMYFCQECGLMYDPQVMVRREAEYVSPIENEIIQAAKEAMKALEENPNATLQDIGAASKANFVVSIPPVIKKESD